MNFFQFAQSTKNKPSASAFNPSSSSFIPFPTMNQEDKSMEQDKKDEINDQNSVSEAHNPILNQGSFIFNPKKVTFANSEVTKTDDGLLTQPQPKTVFRHPETVNSIQDVKSTEPKQIEDIKNNEEEITSENFEEVMNRLESDFKSVASWSQKQLSSIQQLQEEISISLLEGNELLARINSVLNS